MSTSAAVQNVETAGKANLVRGGITAAIGCYLIWGFLPLYFRAVSHVSPFEVIANRILWSLILLLLILSLRGTFGNFIRMLGNGKTLLALTGTSTLIAINWLTYVWAVNNEHVVAASLGYFLNPLVNILLGFVILKERLGRFQWIAVGLTAIGVAIMAGSALDTLWISLALAFSFGFYGLVRKMTAATALQGLAAETLILTPPALAYMAWLAASGSLALGMDVTTTGLLALSGVVTSVPLLLFAVATKRMAYSTLGLVQFIAPTLQFLLGIFVFGETLNSGQLWSFVLIWAGLVLYTVDSLRQARSAHPSIPAIE